MKYSVEITEDFEKSFRKLDKYTQRILSAWISKNLIDCTDPRQHGKALTGNFAGRWRYRIGDYRMICDIEDDKLVIVALAVGHRSKIYR